MQRQYWKGVRDLSHGSSIRVGFYYDFAIGLTLPCYKNYVFDYSVGPIFLTVQLITLQRYTYEEFQCYVLKIQSVIIKQLTTMISLWSIVGLIII